MRYLTYFFLFITLLLSGTSGQAQNIEVNQKSDDTYNIKISDFNQLESFSVETEEDLIFKGQELVLQFKARSKEGAFVDKSGVYSFQVNGKKEVVTLLNGTGELTISPQESNLEIKYLKSGEKQTMRVRVISAWWSIIPPLLAIFFALVFKEVIPSMVLGIFSGTLIFAGFSHVGIVEAFKALIDFHILNALADSGHISIIIFSMLIGGMVAVISKNGGMAGVVNALSNYAKSPRSSQLVTWCLGILIFFDDYANTLVVGNTMRPVTDKYKVSREKLAYLVDSTAAPVAAIAFITTWIGAELGYIDDAIKDLGITEGAYSIFLNSLKYAFYPVLTLGFMLMLIWAKKDFGPMLQKERAAAKGNSDNEEEQDTIKELEEFEPKDNISKRSLNALIPIAVVILLTIVGLLYTGGLTSQKAISAMNIECSGFFDTWSNLGALAHTDSPTFVQKLGIIIGNSDSYQALLWSSLSGLLVAIILSIGQKILSVKESFDATVNGFKAMLPAFVILTLAWSLASVTEQLKTAEFLTSIFSGNVSPIWLATITFLLAALVSFSTGSSWGTMAILYPLIIPTAYFVCQESNLSPDETMEILYNVVSVVLAGSVLGDHCSPISDTTILSSMATQCNHISHVKTQLPYALSVGGVSILILILPVNLGIPWFLNYLIGFGLLFLLVRLFAKPISEN